LRIRQNNCIIYLENPEDVLFKSEKQRIIWEEIQNLRPTKNERSVPGVQTKSGTIAENDTIRMLK
jgi:hypothetical protein